MVFSLLCARTYDCSKMSDHLTVPPNLRMRRSSSRANVPMKSRVQQGGNGLFASHANSRSAWEDRVCPFVAHLFQKSCEEVEDNICI